MKDEGSEGPHPGRLELYGTDIETDLLEWHYDHHRVHLNDANSPWLALPSVPSAPTSLDEVHTRVSQRKLT